MIRGASGLPNVSMQIDYITYCRYGDLEGFWTTEDLTWVTYNKMLSEEVYSDYFGGAYYSQFLVWWWIPAFTAVIAAAAIPSVPYARRVGARNAFASVTNKVTRACFHTFAVACNPLALANLPSCPCV